MADRQAAVDRFQSDNTCRVFIGSITAAGVGITLTAASNVVFAELDFVPANMVQAEDRCHRIGQRESVLIQHLVLDGSLDARMAKILVQKQAIADKALDREIPEFKLPAIPTGKGTEHERMERRPAKYPPATEEQRAAALTAMRMLAGVCDGARARDGAGFCAFDVTIGHKLAGLPGLTDGQVWLAAKLANKYRGQLPSDLVSAAKGSTATVAAE